METKHGALCRLKSFRAVHKLPYQFFGVLHYVEKDITRIRLLYFVYLQSMFSLQNLIATSQDFIFLIFSKMNYLVQLDEERVSDARNQIHRKNDANCAVSFWVSCPSLTASFTEFPKSTLSSLSKTSSLESHCSLKRIVMMSVLMSLSTMKLWCQDWCHSIAMMSVLV